MDAHEEEKIREHTHKIIEVHRHTDPKEYDPELIERIKKAAYNSFAVWGVALPDLEVSYIRELAENVYAVRYTFKLGPIGSTHDHGMFVDYFASTFYLESQTIARLVNKLLDRRLGEE